MNRGEVVEVDWPFSDRTGSKSRPAVVVQADFLNGLIDDTVLVQVTGTRHGLPGTEVEIDPSVEAAKSWPNRPFQHPRRQFHASSA